MAVALDPAGKAGVARRLAVSRPILARVLSENDPTPLSLKLARKICPLTGRPKTLKATHLPWNFHVAFKKFFIKQYVAFGIMPYDMNL
ncbi:MAG: hypothetical protein LBO00_06375 [Zoogloeaceae bacterium]|nr:hypothetical protein [Zoogloeaceae bacterium]